MSDSRLEAVNILLRIEKDAAYSAIAVSKALNKISFSDSRDSAFTVSLVYGVLEHKITIDYNISLYLNSGINKLKKNVLNILRIGAYQIMYLDKIPVSAAVNESVKISKKIGAGYSSGMINAVLRKIALNGIVLPDKQDEVSRLSVTYSVNEDLVKIFVRDYSVEKTEEILSCYNGRRPIFVRHNTLACTEDEFIRSLDSDNVSVKSTDLAHCFAIDNTGDISQLDAYKKGYFHVQDMSSQFCCSLLDVQCDDIVLDCCAAPGGKSFTLAQGLTGKGSITSCDIYEHKTSLIASGAERLHIRNLRTVIADARHIDSMGIMADKVICDVPCSGLGVIGRKPEIRYKSSAELEELPQIQKAILYSAATCVRNGGSLIYSTCTLNKSENDYICDGFLNDLPEFYISDDENYGRYTDRYITVFPEQECGDGFFIAKFKKR